jgi:hypothetical protein
MNKRLPRLAAKPFLATFHSFSIFPQKFTGEKSCAAMQPG